MTPVLSVADLSVNYGGGRVVNNLSLSIGQGEIVALLGPNGAGKTSTLRAICGFVPLETGTVSLAGKDISSMSADHRARSGVFLVPDDRGLFAPIPVSSHLALAARRKLSAEEEAHIKDKFVQLTSLWHTRAGALSGGEAQMLSLAMAVVAKPKILLIDELSFGLAPLVVRRLLDLIREMASESGLAILLVDQLVQLALGVADRALVLRRDVLLEGTAAELIADEEGVRQAYFGR
jgi:branched-chain amino acid transport system ATP-binding protein